MLEGSKTRAALGRAKRWLRPPIDTIETLRQLTPIAASRTSPTLVFHTADQWVGPSVWRTSTWDEDELAWALGFLDNPQHQGTVLDVGANIGTTTVSLLTRHGARRVLAFEPEIRNFRLLRCNLILTALEDRAVARQLAVGTTDGEVAMALGSENLADHRVSDRGGVSVPAGRLDSALTDSEVANVSLVWVDTQGYEGQVMAGASALLGRSVPWVIEYWPMRLREAGGLEMLHSLIAEHFSEIVDVRRSLHQGTPVRLPAERIGDLSRALPGPESDLEHFTDLILLA